MNGPAECICAYEGARMRAGRLSRHPRRDRRAFDGPPIASAARLHRSEKAQIGEAVSADGIGKTETVRESFLAGKRPQGTAGVRTTGANWCERRPGANAAP